MRTIAMYLPQFHTTPENDEWWGVGYTEWTAVRNARPLFEGHNQPRVPMDENYYDLSKKETMQHQAHLMHEYGIDGMCFYHYYFSDGRMALNKPAENLLEWSDIDMPFCFDWANEPWVRTWSNIYYGNTWSEIYEKNDDMDRPILIEQKYGREEAWEKHYSYISSFFRDDRYIKIDGRPVFLIHRASKIPCLYPMIKYWNTIAEKKQLPPAYIIAVNEDVALKGTDASLSLEPIEVKYSDGMGFFECDDVLKRISEAKHYRGQRKYLSTVVDYDTTPRRGKNGTVERGFTVRKFQEEMETLYKKSMSWGNDMVFVNAWNEWGEGMYLEPDELYRTGCLEAIRCAKEKSKNNVAHEDTDVLEVELSKKQAIKYRKNMICLDDWLKLNEKNINLSTILSKYSIHSIAIYGYGMLGKHLLNELMDSEVEIKCIIDRQTEYKNLAVPLYSITDFPKDVDAVIVTALGDYEEIYDELNQRIPKSRVFSVYELVFEALP